MVTMDMPQLINIRTLARELQCSQEWLRAEALAGRLPALRAGGRNVVFARAAVESALARRAAGTIKAGNT